MAGYIGEISGRSPFGAVGDSARVEDRGLKTKTTDATGAVIQTAESTAAASAAQAISTGFERKSADDHIGGAKSDVAQLDDKPQAKTAGDKSRANNGDGASKAAAVALENLGSPVSAALIGKLRQFALLPGFDIDKAALLVGGGVSSVIGDAELLASILSGNFNLYAEIDEIYKALEKALAQIDSTRLTKELAALSVLCDAMYVNSTRSPTAAAAATAFTRAILEAWRDGANNSAINGDAGEKTSAFDSLFNSYLTSMEEFAAKSTANAKPTYTYMPTAGSSQREASTQTAQRSPATDEASTYAPPPALLTAGDGDVSGETVLRQLAAGSTAEATDNNTALKRLDAIRASASAKSPATDSAADSIAEDSAEDSSAALREAPQEARTTAAKSSAPAKTGDGTADVERAVADARDESAADGGFAKDGSYRIASAALGSAGFEIESRRLFFVLAKAVADALFGDSKNNGGLLGDRDASVKYDAATLADKIEALAKLGVIEPEVAARALTSRSFFGVFFNRAYSGGGADSSAVLTERAAMQAGGVAAPADEALKSMYAGMLIRLKHIKTTLESLEPSHKYDETLDRIKRVEDGVRFISDLNNRHQYAQIPIYPGGVGEPLELFVMGRGSGRKKIDPEDATLYIALSTNRLGRVEALIRMGNKKSVSVCVRTGDDGALAELLDARTLLHKKLDDAGFRLSRVTYKHADENLSPASVAKEARVEFGLKTASTSAVDIRT